MPQSLMSVIVLLSWLALPVALICIVDDWFLRPQRLIAAPAPAHDAPLMTFLRLNRERGDGAGVQALEADRLAGFLAEAVRPVFDSA